MLRRSRSSCGSTVRSRSACGCCDRTGGEAFQLTELKGRLQGYEWAPDSERLALLVRDPDPDAPEEGAATPAAPRKAPKPIVIDRYKFKQDVQGYLLSGRHSNIYLFDIASKKFERLTAGKADEKAAKKKAADDEKAAKMKAKEDEKAAKKSR